MVLDFANEADEIIAAFAPYYESTLLSEETDPHLLYDLQQASVRRRRIQPDRHRRVREAILQ